MNFTNNVFIQNNNKKLSFISEEQAYITSSKIKDSWFVIFNVHALHHLKFLIPLGM